MLEPLIFGVALAGSVIASAYDLKTTEVPNWVFYAMLFLGVPAVGIHALLTGNFNVFTVAGITGLGLFAFGYLMYRTGQWGGADMVLLGIMGFMVPSSSVLFHSSLAFPSGLSFLFNLFIIGAVYMIIYAAIFALRDKMVMIRFKSGVKASSKTLLILVLSMLIVFTSIMLYFNSLLGGVLTVSELARGVAFPVIVTAVFFLVYKLAKAVENFGFRKKVPIYKLRVGDMLLNEKKLVGITQRQINSMKRSGKRYVWIKEGVRFAPAFPLALLFTFYLGDAILLIRFLF